MADPKHPRKFEESFKRQIVRLYENGKPLREAMDEYDLGRSTVRRRVEGIRESGSAGAEDNRTPEQNRIIELERENKQLRMEAGVLKNGCADVRPEVAAITENAGRYPTSAQCEILGVPRSTYYRLRGGGNGADEAADPLDEAVREEFERSGGRYGARRIKGALEKRGVVASRRRIRRSMRSQGLRSCRRRKSFRPHPSKPNEADLPNVLDREFDGHAPHTHVRGDLTYVRVGAAWSCVCPPMDLHDREAVGHAAGPRKDAGLVMAAFATVAFPLFDIDVFHTDRGSEFDNAAIDEMPGVFGIERSLSKKGCPFDNAVDESTNKTPRVEFVYREESGDLHDLQVRPADYVWRHDDDRLRSTPDYMSPVEFRLAGLSL